MAVNDNDKGMNSNFGQKFQTGGANLEQERTKQTNATAGHERRGMLGFASRLGAPMGRFSTSENVVAVRDAIQNAMDKHFDNDQIRSIYRIIAADKDKVNIGNISCVLVCSERQSGGVNHIAVNTIMIEKTAPALSPRVTNIDGNNYEEIVTVAELYDSAMHARVVELVSQTYGGKVAVIDAGQMLIPSEMDTQDEEAIQRVTFNAVMACYSVLEDNIPSGNALFKISDIDLEQELLTVNLDYNPGRVENSVGEPIRSDISITLQSKLKNSGGQDQMFEKVLPISRLDAFVDLVYTQPQPQQPGMLPDTKYYYPRVVITRADSELNVNTLELQLLNIVQASILASNSAWMGAYKPRHNVKGVDPRDIGAIGYDVPLTQDPTVFEKVDTKAQDFNEGAFYQFMTTYIHDMPIISMDIAEAGELNWLNGAFVAASMNLPGSREAIVAAADGLTSGEFSKLWNSPEYANSPICREDNRIHLGYYMDENNERKDIRDLDYVAIMNLAGKEDKALVERWEASFSQTQVPAPIRMQDRTNIIKAFLTSPKVKGYAQRITFAPEFLYALGQACHNAGLSVQPNNVHQVNSAGMSRGYANANQMAFNGGHMGNFYHHNQNQGNGWSQHQPYMGRFNYGRR